MAPLMPIIEEDLNISHGAAGSLFLLTSLGYFPGIIGSGFISSRLNHRRTIFLSSAILGIALLGISQCNNLWSIRIGLIIMGFFAGFYIPSGIATLTAMVSSRHWGKALAIHELAPTLSFLAAPLISEALADRLPWRGIVGLLGAIALLLAVGFLRFGKGGDFFGEAPGLKSFKIILAERGFWIMVLLFGLAVGGTMGIYAMLPLYLVVEKGLERNWANTLVAASRVAVPAVTFLSGWATDFFGAKKMLFGVFWSAGMMTILLGMTEGKWLVIFIFLQPLMCSSFFPAGFAALSKAVPSAVQNVAVSFTTPFGFLIGGGLIPALIGMAGDAGNFSLGILFVGLLMFSAGFLPHFLMTGKPAEQ